jgi:hypothetical protein|tara:strand:- start:402 stop:596 length:195 start_codon:yes stop_codon:yes gene_type:complete
VSILLASLVYSDVEEIMTFTELCEKLEHLDEETVMELLEINTEDLVVRFEDRVELHNERLQKEL